MTSTAQDAADILKARNSLGVPETAIILPSNFSAMGEIGESTTTVPYADLPGFPRTPATEDGAVVICAIEGVPTFVLKGRADFYETGDPSLMAGPIETLSLLGVRNILSTTSAASINADLFPGALVAIADHISFSGLNPLIGTGDDKNFVNMHEAYDKRLLRRLKAAAAASGVTIHERVFMWFSGPSSETPAEAKAARILGADVIGMSLAPEAILARRFATPFAGVAIVSELVFGVGGAAPKADSARAPTVAGLVALKRLLRAYVKGK